VFITIGQLGTSYYDEIVPPDASNVVNPKCLCIKNITRRTRMKIELWCKRIVQRYSYDGMDSQRIPETVLVILSGEEEFVNDILERIKEMEDVKIE